MRRGLFKNLIVVLSIFYSVSIMAEDRETMIKAIDCVVDRYIELEAFNGCILVAYDHDILYQRVHGIADPATGELLTAGHRFRLASVSKQFTGLAVMLLKQDGDLNYSDSITKHLPELPYNSITIRQLLTHTSGLPDYGPLLDQYCEKEGDEGRRQKVATNHDVLELFVKHKPLLLFQPGTRHQYCNTGYILLALIVERITGKTFQEFMKTRVFKPSGMENTFVNPANGKLPDKLRAHGFKDDQSGQGYTEFDWHYQNGMYGDGGIYSTVDDMFKYDQILYGEKLVKQQLLSEAFSCPTLKNGEKVDYGFGWSVIQDSRGDFVAHGGGWLGFNSFFLRDYQHGNTVIILTNKAGFRPGKLAFTVYDILHGDECKMPKGSIAALMAKEIKGHDIGHALAKYYALKNGKPDHYDFSESQLNALGYHLINRNRIDDAIRIFQENVKLFPDSWNVYDSLAEAFMKNNDTEKAIKYYMKSLSINPDNDNAKQMLEKLKK